MDLTVDWNASYWNSPPLWRMAAAACIVLIGIMLYVLLSQFLPQYISNIIRSVDRRSRKKAGRSAPPSESAEFSKQLAVFELSVRRFVGWMVILILAIIAVNVLGYDTQTRFHLYGYGFSLWMMINFLIIMTLGLLFTRTVLLEIMRLLLRAVFGGDIPEKVYRKEFRKLRRPIVYLFTLITLYIAVDVAFPGKEDLPLFKYARLTYTVAAVIIGTTFVTVMTLFVFRTKYALRGKIDIHASNAMENFMKILSVIIGLGILLSFLGIDPVTILGALTFIGVAIAFGLQETIANFMAGFMLAADKPFAIGDRVRVGDAARETWGDIVRIGINTTRIRTVEGEMVVVPNSHVAKNEIWNYTRESPVIMHKIGVGISYGSDWRLAKRIMIEEAKRHPRVMRNPQPFVTMDQFAESSIALKLWVWLKNALDREQIRSDLLEAIKDRFDAEGVELPFPYRTVVYKKDTPAERRIPEDEEFLDVRSYPSQGKSYYEFGDWHRKDEGPRNDLYRPGIWILVPTANPANARKLADYAVSIARKTNGEIKALCVMDEASEKKELMAKDVLGIFEKTGRNGKIRVSTSMETGDPVDRIVEYAEKFNADFIIIGKPEKSGVLSWMREDIDSEIRARTTVPVIVAGE